MRFLSLRMGLWIALSACMAAGLTRPARASIDIPVYPGATDMALKHYTRGHFPSTWPNLQASAATVLVYHLPAGIPFDQIDEFYTGELGKDHWQKGLVKPYTGEQYLIYNRDKDQMVLHLREQGQSIAVDAMGIESAMPSPTDALGTNYGQQTLEDKALLTATGGVVSVVCPAGLVHVQIGPVGSVLFTVCAHAAVDYPGVAKAVLDRVKLIDQAGANGLSLCVSAPADQDTSAHLYYEYTVTVPSGSSVSVQVQNPIDAIFHLGQGRDGNVDVKGALGDVTVQTTGPVSVSDAAGKVSVVTTDDPILLTNLSGDVTARTTGWYIKAYGLKLAGKVDLEDTEGWLEVHVDSVQDSGSLKCITTNSAIKLWIPADASVDVNLSARDYKAPFDLSKVEGNSAEPRLHAALNGGRVPLELRTTGGGSVYIQNR